MSLDELVGQGQSAMAAHDYHRAALCLREAARRAPLRSDVRELLGMALEGDSAMGRQEPAAPLAPRPAPRPPAPQPAPMQEQAEAPASRAVDPAPPLSRPERGAATSRRSHSWAWDEQEPDELPSPQEPRPAPQPRMDQPAPAPSPSQAKAWRWENSSRSAGGSSTFRPAAAPHHAAPTVHKEEAEPINFDQRHRRGPLSALFLGALVGLLAMAAAGGGAWWYLQHNNLMGQLPQVGGFSQAQFNAALEQASLLRQRGQYSLAIEQLTALPDDPRRNRELAAIYMEQGDRSFLQDPPNLEGALMAYENAVKSDPDNPEHGIALGVVYLRLGQEDDQDPKKAAQNLQLARQAYEAVITLHPNNVQAMEGLAKVAIALRDPALQANTYRAIIEKAPDSDAAERARRNLQSLGFKL